MKVFYFFQINFLTKVTRLMLSRLNNLFFKIQKKILQSKYVIPYQIQELELGNYKTKAQYSRKEIYANGRNYSCLHPIYDRIETREFEQRFVYEVKDVVVDTFTGNVFDSSSSLILESSSWSESWHISGRVPGVNSKPRFKKYMQHEQSNSIVLPSNSFFHWVNEGRTVFANGKPTLRVHAYSKPWSVWLNRGEKIVQQNHNSKFHFLPPHDLNFSNLFPAVASRSCILPKPSSGKGRKYAAKPSTLE